MSDALAYFEFSAPFDRPDEMTGDDLENAEHIQMANPALGIRIPLEHVEHELASMDPRTFAVERLGVGDWPDTTRSNVSVIPVEHWDRIRDVRSAPAGDVVFGLDVTPDRGRAAIAVAGQRRDGLTHVEITDDEPGTGWVAKRARALTEKHGGRFVVDARSPAASLVSELENEHVKVEVVNTQEYAQACGLFFDVVERDTLRHLGTTELRNAVRGAITRPLGESWAWSRRSSAVNIAPLVAATLAVWWVASVPSSVYEEREMASA